MKTNLILLNPIITLCAIILFSCNKPEEDNPYTCVDPPEEFSITKSTINEFTIEQAFPDQVGTPPHYI